MRHVSIIVLAAMCGCLFGCIPEPWGSQLLDAGQCLVDFATAHIAILP